MFSPDPSFVGRPSSQGVDGASPFFLTIDPFPMPVRVLATLPFGAGQPLSLFPLSWVPRRSFPLYGRDNAPLLDHGISSRFDGNRDRPAPALRFFEGEEPFYDVRFPSLS